MRDLYWYRGCAITRSCNPAALRWLSYCDGRFLAADTLKGMRQIIKETLGEIE